MKKQFAILTIIVNILFIFTTYGNSVSAYPFKCEEVITEKCGPRYKISPESMCNSMHKNKSQERINSCIKTLEESRKKEKKEYSICRERVIKSKQYKDCTSKYFLPPGNPIDYVNSLPARVKFLLMLAGIFVAVGLFKFSGYIIEKFIWILGFIVPSIRKKRFDSAKKFADDAKQTFSDAKQGFDSTTKKTRSGFSDMFKNMTNNKQDINARLKKLKKLLEDNAISKEEYEEQRKKIIGDV